MRFGFSMVLSVAITSAASASTVKSSRYTYIVESPSSVKPVCEIIKGSELTITGNAVDAMWLPVRANSGPCAGKSGFVSAELVALSNTTGLRLSRSAPLVASTKDLKFGCYALENSPVEKIGEDKSAITSVKVRVLDGPCKGEQGWVSPESLQQ